MPATKGWVEKFACGSKTYIRPNNKKYKKIQSILKSNYDRYYTLDNGGAPFVVCVDNRKDVCKKKSTVIYLILAAIIHLIYGGNPIHFLKE